MTLRSSFYRNHEAKTKTKRKELCFFRNGDYLIDVQRVTVCFSTMPHLCHSMGVSKRASLQKSPHEHQPLLALKEPFFFCWYVFPVNIFGSVVQVWLDACSRTWTLKTEQIGAWNLWICLMFSGGTYSRNSAFILRYGFFIWSHPRLKLNQTLPCTTFQIKNLRMVDFVHHFGLQGDFWNPEISLANENPPFVVPKSLQDLQQPGKKRNLTRVKLVISPITFTADKGEVFIQSHGVPTGGQFGSWNYFFKRRFPTAKKCMKILFVLFFWGSIRLS